MNAELNGEQPRHVFIAGAGTMGHGLALVMAKAGHPVSLMDVEEGILAHAREQIAIHLQTLAETGQMDGTHIEPILSRITTTTEADTMAEADLILEAISEDVSVKREFFAQAADRCRADTPVASNTSYLNIFELAPETLQHRLLICHFFAPPYLIPLVEIVKGPQTAAGVVDDIRALLSAAGQSPVVLQRFVPGFIINRLQRAMGREIFYLIDEGLAAPEEIDRAVLASLAIRMPVLGVVRRLDFAGLDFTDKVLSNPSISLVNEDRPSRKVRQLVEEGKLGVKSGRGFYDYRKQGPAQAEARRDRLLIEMKSMITRIMDELWRD